VGSCDCQFLLLELELIVFCFLLNNLFTSVENLLQVKTLHHVVTRKILIILSLSVTGNQQQKTIDNMKYKVTKILHLTRRLLTIFEY